jgi:hypothetical protein
MLGGAERERRSWLGAFIGSRRARSALTIAPAAVSECGGFFPRIYRVYSAACRTCGFGMRALIAISICQRLHKFSLRNRPNLVRARTRLGSRCRRSPGAASWARRRCEARRTRSPRFDWRVSAGGGATILEPGRASGEARGPKRTGAAIDDDCSTRSTVAVTPEIKPRF